MAPRRVNTFRRMRKNRSSGGQRVRYQCNGVLGAGVHNITFTNFQVANPMLLRPCRNKYVVVRISALEAGVSSVAKIGLYTPANFDTSVTGTEPCAASTEKIVANNVTTFVVRCPRVTDFACIDGGDLPAVVLSLTGRCTWTMDLCIEYKNQFVLNTVV